MDELENRITESTNSVLAEISRTDTKAGVLFTSISLPCAALIAFTPEWNLPTGPIILTYLGTSGLIAAMLAVLTVVRPALRGAPRGTFVYWSTCKDPDEVLADLTPGRLTSKDKAEQIIRLSRIATRKHTGLRVAVDITCGALLTLAVALATAQLTS